MESKHEKINYPNRQFLKDLWMILGKFRWKVSFWLGVRLLSSAVILVPSFAIARIIDLLSNGIGASQTSIYYWVFAILISSSFATIIRLGSKFKIGDISREAQKAVRLQGFKALLNFSLTWHEQEASGNKVQRINNGAEGIRKFMRFMSERFTDILVNVIGVGIIFSLFNLKYTILLTVYICCYLTYEIYLNKKISQKEAQKKAYSEHVSGKVHEIASNISTVKSLRLGKNVEKRARGYEQELNILKRDAQLINTKKWWGIQLISDFFYALFVFIIVLDVFNARISLGSVVLFMDYVSRTRKSLNDFSVEFDSVIEAKYEIYRIIPFLNLTQSTTELTTLPTSWKKITFKEVTFAYKKCKILEGVNFTINRGEKIGIVGISGSGKSTLLKILLRLYQPLEGEVYFDDIPLSRISTESLGKNITIVPQEVDLFNLSFLENISISRKGKKNQKDILKSLKVSQCQSIIDRLTHGLETMVGERGVRLSGGEKQRVGIARAIYANTPLILLDEATSHLDSRTEKMILENLEEQITNKTIIIIAHRLSTLQHLDKIIFLKQGKIVEQGKFEELLKRKGEFYQLYKLQEKAQK